MPPLSPLEALRAELALKSSPRLAKCPSRRERNEERAAHAFDRAIEAVGWSHRETARRLGICERLLRDYLSGARQLPAWVPLSLPKEGQVAYLSALTHDVDEPADDEGAERCA